MRRPTLVALAALLVAIALLTWATQTPAPPIRSMGLIPPHLVRPLTASKGVLVPRGSRPVLSAVPHLAALPLSVDLSAWAEPVQNQADVNACASYSTVALHYWYVYHTTGARPPLYSPMYQFAQITHGQNVGTSFDDNFNIQVQQGTEPLQDYSYGVAAGQWDYTDQPTAQDHAYAALSTTTGWQYVSTATGVQNESIIQEELAAGNPVEIGISVYDNFYNYTSTSPPITGTTSGTLYGYHGIVLYGYNATGPFGENQWTTQWGQNGWFQLTWSFVDQNIFAMATINGVSNAPQPTPTAAPTAMPTRVPPPTATPVRFHVTRWNQYRLAHGLTLIPYQHNGRLVHISWAWEHDQWHQAPLRHWCGGVMHGVRRSWSGDVETLHQRFQGCVLAYSRVGSATYPLHLTRTGWHT